MAEVALCSLLVSSDLATPIYDLRLLETPLGLARRFTPGPPFHLLLRLRRERPVNHQNLSDRLNGLRSGGVANLGNKFPARFAVVAQNTNFDELVARKVQIYFADHRRFEPFLPDHDDRLQRVGTRAQRAAFGWIEFFHWNGLAWIGEQ